MVLILTANAGPFRSLALFPSRLRLAQGQEKHLLLGLPVPVYVRADRRGLIMVNGQPLGGHGWRVIRGQSLDLQPVGQGQARLELRLLGIVPLRSLAVEIFPPVEVVPGGHSIGVLLRAEGVLVVGYSSLVDRAGKPAWPAREAGIKVGDVIRRVDGQVVNSDEELARIIDEDGRRTHRVRLEVRRGDEAFSRTVEPRFDTRTGRYRIGLFVRDGTAGVGTLTFYDPATRRYSALGHVITDQTTNRPVDVLEGQIVQATVAGIEQGRRGQPGEKIGMFVENRDVIGNIEMNTSFGIMGTLNQPLPNPLFPGPVTIAMASEVRLGPAEILTVVSDRKLERYKVRVLKAFRQDQPGAKGMVIKITDPRLLRRTGGIVQGMSGSPILQDGKLIGAVTHVFVNDPTRGYGVYMEWIAAEAGLLPRMLD